eukprot:g8741.t1
MYSQHGTIIYQGNYDMGEKHGNGCLYHRSGAPHQEGLFENDNIIDGTTYRSDGSIEYKGEYKEGLPHGIGKYIFDDGTSFYEGSFNRGLFDGPGVEKRMRGKLDHVIEGVWISGRLEDKEEDYLSKRIHTDWDHIIDPEHEVDLNQFWPESDDECASIIQDIWKDFFYKTYLPKIRRIQNCWRLYKVRCPTKRNDKHLWETAVRAMQYEQDSIARSERLAKIKEKLLPVDIIAKRIRRKHFKKLKSIMLPADEMDSEQALEKLIEAGTVDSSNAMDALLGVATNEEIGDQVDDVTAGSSNAMDALLGVATNEEIEDQVNDATAGSSNAMDALLGVAVSQEEEIGELEPVDESND